MSSLSLRLSRGWDTQLHDTSSCCRDLTSSRHYLPQSGAGNGKWIKWCYHGDMKNAIQEEIAFARRRWEGCHNYGVEYVSYGIVDGGYVKRTYGHAYDSKAGCAVIIGGKTKQGHLRSRRGSKLVRM